MKTVAYTYHVSVKAKSDAVFGYIADLTWQSEWDAHLHVTAKTPGEIKVGSFLASDSRLPQSNPTQNAPLYHNASSACDLVIAICEV